MFIESEILIGEKKYIATVTKHPFRDQSEAYHDLLAHFVSDWINHENHMLPKKPQEVLDFMAQGRSVLVFQDQHFVGHSAITMEYSGKQIEIGSIISAPYHRREGVGKAATLAVVKLAELLYPGWSAFALANPQSAKLLEGLGARRMSTVEITDPVAWKLCDNCPKRPIQIPGQDFVCCDTPYDLAPLKKEAGKRIVSWVIKRWESNPNVTEGHER